MDNYKLKSPIALIIFKRPDTTKQVFEAIRQAKPSKLFVIADGPRADRPGEAEKCAAARAVIDRVDWDCEVIKNYSDVNLGCGKRVASGLDWVFEQVEEAIILEDDCVPDPTFFQFCEELLEKYRYDSRVFTVSAQGFAKGYHREDYSYYFSRYTHSWGWATWKRSWQFFDLEMRHWKVIQEQKILNNVLEDHDAVKDWTNILEATYNKEIDTWDYQWMLSCWLQSGLSIHPISNLVSNIGFEGDATHLIDSKFLAMRCQSISFPLLHPPFIIRDVKADRYLQRRLFRASFLDKLRSLKKRILMA